MKKSKLMQILFFVTVMIFSLAHCKKDDPAAPYTCGSCVQEPEALAIDDIAPSGIYKGSLQSQNGTSGAFKVDVDTDKSAGTFSINTTKTLYESTSFNHTDMGTYDLYEFDSTQIDFDLELWPDGSIRYSSLTLNGYPVHVAVVKELSTALVQTWEGTYSGDSSGVWNMVIIGSDVYCVSYDYEEGDINLFTGTLTGNTISITAGDPNLTATGTTSGDTSSGNWTYVGEGSGSWSGIRTQ